MNPIQNNILEWLHKRGLTDEVINKSQLSFNGNEIVIPAFNENKELLFNKYRQNPFNSEGPKYKYDKGSESSLFNIHTIKDIKDEPIFICEGELDCLLLNSLGLYSVTSTGGSGTFKKEWASYFTDRNIYIVYDKDDAGYKGAMKVQGIIPHAKIVFLPNDMDGNDITDYFQYHTLKDFFKLDSYSYPIPREPSGIPNTKKEMKKLVDIFKNASNELLEIKREFIRSRRNIKPIMIMLEYVITRYETYNHTLKSFDRKFPKGEGNTTDIIKAKQTPITQFIQFNYDGFAKCIWHNEKTASMKYNLPDSKYPNTVKCYGCGMMGDSIDVIMQLRQVDFKEAVNILNNG